MKYAEVSVNSPIARRQTFSYAIPSDLAIVSGQAVWVPFGAKVLQGIVMELSDYPQVDSPKEIAGIIELRPLLFPSHIKLARWISDYYLSPLFDAVALMLPPGFERNVLTFITPAVKQVDVAALSAEQQELLDFVRAAGKVSVKDVEKKFGVKRARTLIPQLVHKGVLLRQYELEKIKVRAKIVSLVRLAVTPEEVEKVAAGLRQRTRRQADFLELLSRQDKPMTLVEARRAGGPSVNALISKRLVTVEQLEVARDPVRYKSNLSEESFSLTTSQQSAVDAINSSLQQKRPADSHPSVYLLHGITGSGKTEIYLQALAETVRLGKKGIVLVPEIALTPQTIERFAARFPRRVAVLHSGLSLGEQFDEWQRIRKGEFDVVIGPRSATFAPQPDLGLIVIDEEHEWTYKQTDQSPHYHARDAAIKLAELTGAVVVLGSATPVVESYYHAQRGDYRLLELGERVAPDAVLPKVDIVDLKEELESGNRSLFSRELSKSLGEVLGKKEQAILFLNRRGAASFIQCRNCGFVLRCKRCEVALSFHSEGNTLVCHQCNYRTLAPQTCPRCGSKRISFLGVGIQKVQEEAGTAFPAARLIRWDSDVTELPHAHELILEKVRAHEADILIGTQMIAKGLDLPLITLVGVISADTSLNLPDFRAGEKTFQLLCQVAGRAGRSRLGGKVIIQTFAPEHYAVQAAARHDYLSFYNTEIGYRRQLGYPPFTRLACLTYSHTNETRCQHEAERMKQLLTDEIARRGIGDLNIIGRAQAFIQRLRGHLRWQLVLRGRNLSELLEKVIIPQGWVVDIDPVSLI